MQPFTAAFENVPFRAPKNVRHDLVELLVIAFIAVLCGGQNCSGMAPSSSLFRRFLQRRHGIPPHGTFSTVLRMDLFGWDWDSCVHDWRDRAIHMIFVAQ
jgi:DDE_Tnp_1-associated